MFCRNCGNALPEGAKFCSACVTPAFDPGVQEQPVYTQEQPVYTQEQPAYGQTQPLYTQEQPVYDQAQPAYTQEQPAYTQEQPAYGQTPPVYTPPAAPGGPGKKKPGKRLLMAAAVVVVVVLALVLVVSGAFGSAKSKATGAMIRSVEVYSDAWKSAGLPDTQKLLESEKYSQALDVSIAEMGGSGYYDLSALKGFGLSMGLDTDIPGKQLALSLGARYGSADLISAQLAVEDNEIYAGVPELLGEGNFYGVDTETLGKDMVKLGADSEMEPLGFNLFELVQIVTEAAEPDKDMVKDLEKGWKEFAEAITVEKTGKEEIEVNGHDVSCTAYEMVIPQEALEDLLDVMLDAAGETDYAAMVEDLMLAIGAPKESVQEALDEMELDSMDSAMEEARAELQEALDILGDIELDLYVKSRQVMAVEYEKEVEGTTLTIGIYMGGGKEAADDFSLRVEIDDNGYESLLTLVSTGDHTASKGTFTDETTLRVIEDGMPQVEIVSELEYTPKEKEDNFSWSLKENKWSAFDIQAEGLLTAPDGGVALELDELTVEVDGEELVTLEVEYRLGAFDMGVKAKDPTMLSRMDEADLEEAAEEIMTNAQSWAMGLMNVLPPELVNELF